MDFTNAREVILAYLQINKGSTNTKLINLIGGDKTLFESVKEDLIFSDLAEDKKGAGLVYCCRDTLVPENNPEIKGKPDAKTYKIFISYGRKDAEDLANRLFNDLKAKGHDVWLDKEQIRTGKSWEDQIEKGILSSELFITLLTPHAVRRPDGICLDEISMARYNNRRIIPLMVINCRPPLGIFRLDWLDLQDWNNPVKYERTLEKIFRLFQTNESEVECINTHIFNLLKPIDFKLDIYQHVKDFIGREWILEDIRSWAGRPEEKVLFITGNPGTGKTALMSKLIHLMPQVGAYHFCIAKFESSLIPEKFIHSIASQLATQLPEYREILSQMNLQSLVHQEPGVLIKQLLIDPLVKIQQEEPVIIIIDALDEALYYGNENIVKLLYNWLDDFPLWIKIIITSRKVPEILGMFSFCKPYEINVDCNENRDDIKQYVIDMLSHKHSSTEETYNINDLAEKIASQSEGIFLYAKTIIQNLLTGKFTVNEVKRFPAGLTGIYQANFTRLFPSDEKFLEVKLLLGIMLAAFKPLTIDELTLFQACNKLAVRKQLNMLAEFFPENEGTYSAFHKSLADWLLGNSTQQNRYLCDVVRGHSIISDTLLKDFGANGIDEYMVQYLPKHLFYAGRLKELQLILIDINYIQARCAIHQVYSLIEDYKLYLSSSPSLKIKVNNQSDDQLWDRERHTYETELFDLNLTIDKTITIILDFLYKHAGLIQLYGNVPGFVRQQAYNEGLVPLVFNQLTGNSIWNNCFLLTDYSRKQFDPFPFITKVFYEHKLGISDLSLSNDEQWLLSASFDKTVRLWNLRNGECHKSLKFDNIVESLVIAPDASCIAIGGTIANFSILLYDRTLDNVLDTLDGHSARIVMMRLSQNNRLVSCSSDHSFICWDINTKTILYKRQYSSKLLACSISADGTIVAVSTSENCVEVWNIDIDFKLFCIRHEKGEVRSLLLTHDGKELIIGGGEDKQTEVWDLDLHKLKYKISGHGTLTYCLAQNKKKTILITGGSDRYLKVWDFGTGKILKEFESHTRVTRRIAITGDMQNVVTGGGWNSDHNIRIVDIIRGTGLIRNDLFSLSAIAVFNFEEKGLIIGVNRKSLFSIIIESGERKILKEKLVVLAAFRIEEVIYLSLQNGSVISYNINTLEWNLLLQNEEAISALFKLSKDEWVFGDWKGNVFTHKPGKTTPFDSIRASKIKIIFKTGEYIVVLDFDDNIMFIDKATWKLFGYYKHDARITSNIASGKDHIFFGDSRGDLVAYNISGQSSNIMPATQKVAITSILFYEKFDRLISGNSSGYLTISKPGTLTTLLEFKGHESSVNFLKIYSGYIFLSVSGNYYSDKLTGANETKDTTMKTWNIFTGENVGVYAADNLITAIAVCDDEKVIIGQRNGFIQMFNPHSIQSTEKES